MRKRCQLSKACHEKILLCGFRARPSLRQIHIGVSQGPTALTPRESAYKPKMNVIHEDHEVACDEPLPLEGQLAADGNRAEAAPAHQLFIEAMTLHSAQEEETLPRPSHRPAQWLRDREMMRYEHMQMRDERRLIRCWLRAFGDLRHVNQDRPFSCLASAHLFQGGIPNMKHSIPERRAHANSAFTCLRSFRWQRHCHWPPQDSCGSIRTVRCGFTGTGQQG